VYSICKKNYSDGTDSSQLCLDVSDLLPDKYCNTQSYCLNIASNLIDLTSYNFLKQVFKILP